MDERDRIIDTIKKCLALGDREKNEHEGEVENALRMAKSLMTKHNLTMADVAEKTGVLPGAIKEEETVDRAGAMNWEYDLPWVCCKLFDVRYFINIKSRRHQRKSVTFVGYEQDVALAVEVYKLLKMELMEMARKWGKDNMDETLSPKGMWVRKAKYLDGVVYTLVNRAAQQAEGLTKAEVTKVTALVVRKDQTIDKFISEKHKNLKTTHRRYSDNHADAMEEGQRDGKKVSLSFKDKIKPDNDQGPRNMLKAFEL